MNIFGSCQPATILNVESKYLKSRHMWGFIRTSSIKEAKLEHAESVIETSEKLLLNCRKKDFALKNSLANYKKIASQVKLKN